jgi:polyisoprenoid-binding protein YceI
VKCKDFFDEQNQCITFHSTKTVQTGRTHSMLDGDCTIRGVTKAEKLTLKVEGADPGTGLTNGTITFDRKQGGLPCDGSKAIRWKKLFRKEQICKPLSRI